MGRLPAFEKDDVIDKASQVFLRNGFRRTTIKDITKATGLQPGSIYSALRQLAFLDACDKKQDTSLDALKTFFKMTSESVAHRTPDAHCLLVYGALEIPDNEKDLRYYVQLKLQEIESRIYVLLVKAQENDVIIRNENPIELARFLMTLLFGHRVLAQLHASPETIDNTIDRVFKYLELSNK